jgi:hypothetical protein
MIPVSRLRLKRPTGWFAAGHEVATALPLLSDAAFRLYVFLCLNVDRHSARMVWEPMELANLLQRDRQSVSDALEELCRREICLRHPDTDNRIAIDRLSVEICDRFWPYEKPPVEEFGIDQNRYVQQTRQMLSVPACVRVNFSAADERLASLNYFSALVNEVAETSVGEDYWKHMQHKVNQLERMWLERTPAGG